MARAASCSCGSYFAHDPLRTKRQCLSLFDFLEVSQPRDSVAG